MNGQQAYDRDLALVRAEQLCIGCGACVAVDPSLELQLNPRTLMFEPSGDGGEEAAGVCPSVRVDYAGLQETLYPDAPVGPIGVVERIVLAQSTNLERNRRASSGGLIKEVLLELLASPDVDGVIALRRHEGLDYRPALIRSAEEVERLPGSIYHAVSFAAALRLLRENAGRFVLVAIPCQLEGVYTYICRHAPELRERIFMTVGLICGWTYSHHALRAMCTYAGVDPDDVDDVSYRGEGAVGPLRLRRRGGGNVEIRRRNNLGYAAAFDRSYNVPRCHLCVNHVNVLADLVVGDAWLRRTAATETGVSLVITRNARAGAVIDRLESDGRIVTEPSSLADVEESQSRDFAYGDFAYGYAEYLRETGARPPDLEGPGAAAARPVSREEARSFHRRLWYKIDLQQRRAYRYLWIRKVLKESRMASLRTLLGSVVQRLRGAGRRRTLQTGSRFR